MTNGTSRSIEVINGKKAVRNLEHLAKAQAKLDVRVELKTPAKQVLETSARCFLGDIERSDNEVRISGRVVTRVIYVDESDNFNSEERTDSWSERLVLKDAGSVLSLAPAAHVMETRTLDATSPSFVETVTVVDVVLLGVTAREISYVRDLRGDVETRTETMRHATFGVGISNTFEVEERIDLDKNCTGILGTDVIATVRDIHVGDGKATIKGVVCANIMAVRGGDDNSLYSDNLEFDFTKTITNKAITIDDVVTGAVSVTHVTIKAEADEGRPKLLVGAELSFHGHTITHEDVEQVTDAFCFTNALNFMQGNVESVSAQPQVNSFVEVEGNVTMPQNSPFITKILAVGMSKINSINIVPTDGKVTVEGNLSTAVTFECEEHRVHSTVISVPFSTVVKISGINVQHSIQVYASIMAAKVKARRGREILVDARIALNIATSVVETQPLVIDVTVGEEIKTDDAAILIYTVGENETLWDVAKRIACRSAEIIRQNPSLSDGVNPGDKIFIYRQEVVGF